MEPLLRGWESFYVIVGSSAVALAGYGVAGVIYTSFALHHVRMQQDYQPVFEDWLWHGLLPLAACLMLIGGGVAAERASVEALFVIGGATIALVFVGIHNAWDTVTYLVMQHRSRHKEENL